MIKRNNKNTYSLYELAKLAIGLQKRGIVYTLRPLHGGLQIVCNGWDAVCHDYSYGHEEGLLEIMGILVADFEDDVEGYLTADEILYRLDS